MQKEPAGRRNFLGLLLREFLGEIVGQQVVEAVVGLISELLDTGAQVDATSATSSSIAMGDVADFLTDHHGIKDLVTKKVGPIPSSLWTRRRLKRWRRRSRRS